MITGVSTGVPTEMRLKNAIRATSIPFTTSGSNTARGSLVKAAVTVPPTVVVAGGSDTELEGFLGEDFIDPATLPSLVQNMVWGAGELNFNFINNPATVWKEAAVYLVNVSGTVAQGDFCRATSGGVFIGTGGTNDILNGFIRCYSGNNGVAAAPIEVNVNLT